MLLDNIKLAFVNLSHRRLRSWLTMIGIFIGIAAVVSLIGLGEGLRTAITSQFGFLGSDVLSIQAAGLTFAGPPGSGAVTPLSDDLVDELEKINGVESAFNRKIGSITIEFDDRQRIGYAGSIPLGENRKNLEMMINLKTESGRMLRDGEDRSVVLGNDFTDKERFGRAINIGDRLLLNDISFTVVGILQKKGSFTVDSTVLINEDVKEIFPDDGTTDVIVVKVRDEKDIDAVQESVEKVMRKERQVKIGEEDFTVSTPQKTLETLDSTLFAVQLFVYIIASISLAVGGIGIMNTMYTAVLERTKEIGIMKAIGARNSTVFTIFFFESGFLGMVGGIIGVLIGAGIAEGMSLIGRVALGSDLIQATISLELVLGALMFSFFLGTLFGVLPALQASRMQPVDALRSK
jgi:putative ABC transport system permease protein